jgi:hypothetical protein
MKSPHRRFHLPPHRRPEFDVGRIRPTRSAFATVFKDSVPNDGLNNDPIVTMLNKLDSEFSVSFRGTASAATELTSFNEAYPDAPSDVAELFQEATEIEMQHVCGVYLRFWGPSGCVEMDQAYGISKRIPGAVPIGDDGGKAILYMNGKEGFGLYVVGYGALDAEEAVWVAPSLTALLTRAAGIPTLSSNPSRLT